MALQCLCDLAVALSHFNFRSNILNVVVPRMNSKALQGKVCALGPVPGIAYREVYRLQRGQLNIHLSSFVDFANSSFVDLLSSA